MVYLFLADGFEEVEALTPLDYLRRAGLTVASVGVTGRRVTGSHGIEVTADITADEVDFNQMEMIILPGGMPGTLNLEKSPVVQQAVDLCALGGKPIGAICAAPSILGHKSLLRGRKATCFPGFEQTLAGASVVREPVVCDGQYITARGAGVSQQFAFALIEKACGKEKADSISAAVQW